MSLEIEVDKLAAHLVELDGSAYDVEFFLHRVSAHDLRHESVGDRLNDPQCHFVPCQVGGETWLLRVGSIAYVRFAEPPPEIAMLEEVGAARARVDLSLRDGEHLAGDLVYPLRWGTRASDHLNDEATRFVLLRTAEGDFYVNRDAISRVSV